MLRRWKKYLFIAALGLVLLSAWLLLAPGLNIPSVGAQNFLEEDERLALELWGDTRDPNIEAIFATQVVSGADLRLNEVHLGYDKAIGALLEDPTISRSAFQFTGQRATELKQESDIDPSRIRFGSNYQFSVEPGFAPEVQEQLARAALPGASGDAESPYVVIQFSFPVDLEVKRQLEKSGVVFGDPIDKLSFYVKIPRSALPDVTRAVGAGKVNFVGAPPPEARVAESLKAKITETPHERLPINVQLFESPTPAQLEALGTFMSISQVSDGPLHLVHGTSEAAQLLKLAQYPLVQWVEEEALAELGNLTENSLARELSLPPANFEGNLAAGADIVKQLGFNGSGINVGIIDTGIAHQGSTYHPDLPASRIIDQYYWAPDSAFESPDAPDDVGHGTHIAGTIGGSGAYDSDYSWQGLAPAVKFLIYRLNKNNGGFQVPDFQAALQRGASRNMNVANLSFGGYNGQYLADAQMVDRAVRGEFGFQQVNMVTISHNHNALVGDPGTAKNALTVGAVKDGNWPQRTFTFAACSDDNWPPAERVCFSNFGPVDADNDGATRVKPDIVAPGVATHSTMAWYLSPSGQNYYVAEAGTSMAAPQVSGSVALFLDVYDWLLTWPEVVKAAFIVSATDVGGANVAQYGRGMLNLFHAIYDQPNINDTTYWTGSFATTGSTASHTFTVPAGFEEVRVALTWADPVSGAGNDDVINDLDVKVYDGSGTQVGSSSTSDDTVEYVKVTNGTPGTWRIEANAFSLSSTQTYGLASLVILNKADLSISGSMAAAGTTSYSRDFYVYSILTNKGFAAPGSYVQLQLPNAIFYGVRGARIYTADGRSHLYDATQIHHDPGFRYWDIATGESIYGHPRVIRWHVRYTASDCPTARITLQAYYRNAGATVLEDTTSIPFPCQQPKTYLPFILKQPVVY